MRPGNRSAAHTRLCEQSLGRNPTQTRARCEAGDCAPDRADAGRPRLGALGIPIPTKIPRLRTGGAFITGCGLTAGWRAETLTALPPAHRAPPARHTSDDPTQYSVPRDGVSDGVSTPARTRPWAGTHTGRRFPRAIPAVVLSACPAADGRCPAPSHANIPP